MTEEEMEKAVAQVRQRQMPSNVGHVVSLLMDDQVWIKKGRPYCWQFAHKVNQFVVLEDTGYGMWALFENGELLGTYKDMFRSHEYVVMSQPFGVYQRIK